ncbi:MAG TPA: SDR family NAD(P)-dependent oxidoreductase [Acidimicrobiales bacterium]
MGALDGKVAIVSGAGQGLGRAHALTLAEEGASVVVNDVSGAQGVVDEITAAGGKAVAHGASVSDWKAGKELIDQAVETFGDLHVLVNNAGILRDKMSFSMDEAEWDAVIDVHLKGHFCLSHHAGVWWREQAKTGAATPRRIINTTSEAGLFGSAGQANYASAKGGIVTLTWVLARELGKYGVTANVIAPRARTQMTESMSFFAAPEGGGFDRYDPFHVSKAVAWLATDGTSDINGQVFIVIGGDVHLVRPFDIANTIHRDGGWTVEQLASARGELFGDRPTGPPMTGVAS